jgi:arylformamidase
MTTPILDISPALHPGTAVWPGDVQLRRDVALAFTSGHNLELSSVTTTVHIGAHADAPSHYHADGAAIADRPLAPYLGPCQVMTARVAPGARVMPADLPAPVTARRVLIRTDSFPDPDVFNTDFASLSPELIHALADAGVVLVGIDTPSVDPFDSKALESHQALFQRDLAVLEGLVLHDAPDGAYTLVALPLKLRGADASPVRAVLLPAGALPEAR